MEDDQVADLANPPRRCTIGAKGTNREWAGFEPGTLLSEWGTGVMPNRGMAGEDAQSTMSHSLNIVLRFPTRAFPVLTN